ncbi:MAG: adenosylcobinamide-phosphate synthase CbiB [Neomegalonema sp.]|nr:adenosylcobinamide-phosphate synthase CbiB [Neomegalonema sp.]
MTLGLLFGDADATLLALLLALMLDARFGEPSWLWSRMPHPAALLGRGVDQLERRLNRGSAKRVKGLLALALLATAALAIGGALAAVPYVGPLFATIGAAILIAQRSLIEHIEAVAIGLQDSLAEGRFAVSMVVGRDPKQLDEPAVARAAIESAAENFSDGVVAPAFWFLLGGLPGILAYKAINTADSMIGHRSERYRAFGWASARLDDLVNLIPARLSAALIALSTQAPRRALRTVWRDAHKHLSPNAGWPEAAMAGGLGVMLGGPRRYGAQIIDGATLYGEGWRDPGPAEIMRATRVLSRAWILLCAAIIGAIGVLMLTRYAAA